MSNLDQTRNFSRKRLGPIADLRPAFRVRCRRLRALRSRLYKEGKPPCAISTLHPLHQNPSNVRRVCDVERKCCSRASFPVPRPASINAALSAPGAVRLRPFKSNIDPPSFFRKGESYGYIRRA